MGEAASRETAEKPEVNRSFAKRRRAKPRKREKRGGRQRIENKSRRKAASPCPFLVPLRPFHSPRFHSSEACVSCRYDVSCALLFFLRAYAPPPPEVAAAFANVSLFISAVAVVLSLSARFRRRRRLLLRCFFLCLLGNLAVVMRRSVPVLVGWRGVAEDAGVAEGARSGSGRGYGPGT